MSDPLEQLEFAANPEPRCAAVLLLDTSGSMSGQPIAKLNAGLKEFGAALKGDRLASLRVEVAVVTFGGSVRCWDVTGDRGREAAFDAAQAFVSAGRFVAPALTAEGDTPMGEAVQRGLALLRERKEIYKRNALDYYRPWVMLITDGRPTDSGWEGAAEAIKAEESRRGLSLYAIGVQSADIQTLARFSGQRPPVSLQGLAFRELFQWLSKSLGAVAQSRTGDQVPLAPVGWAATDTSH